ncbi:hypothetical protein ACFFSW_25680 [Saccharothrix longispora]|uniref:Vitamin K epoxide reductase family protein n=1 Tax=Saccharothrix longispora TaxID=33920 RepID=A0ABU1PNY5_9PSEU|nr:hypothetical protein [Saccharothrix longispora]MDR6592338.1 hypothetical protein [Saccharothrix longispora]
MNPWWRRTIVITAVAAGAWAVTRSEWWTWLRTGDHPVCDVVEGLSWISAVLAVMPTAIFAIAWAWRGATTREAAATRAEPRAAASTVADTAKSRFGPLLLGFVPSLLVLVSGHLFLVLHLGTSTR